MDPRYGTYPPAPVVHFEWVCGTLCRCSPLSPSAVCAAADSVRGIYTSGHTHSLLSRARESAVRGRVYKMMKKHCCSRLRSNFFSFTVVRLSSDVVGLSAPSVNAFKRRRLDKYWTNYWIKKISYLQDKQWTAKRPRGPKSNRTDFILGTLY